MTDLNFNTQACHHVPFKHELPHTMLFLQLFLVSWLTFKLCEPALINGVAQGRKQVFGQGFVKWPGISNEKWETVALTHFRKQQYSDFVGKEQQSYPK